MICCTRRYAGDGGRWARWGWWSEQWERESLRETVWGWEGVWGWLWEFGSVWLSVLEFMCGWRGVCERGREKLEEMWWWSCACERVCGGDSLIRHTHTHTEREREREVFIILYRPLYSNILWGVQYSMRSSVVRNKRQTERSTHDRNRGEKKNPKRIVCLSVCVYEQEDRESKKLVYMCDNEHCNYSEDAGDQPGDSMIYYREEVHSKHKYVCKRTHTIQLLLLLSSDTERRETSVLTVWSPCGTFNAFVDGAYVCYFPLREHAIFLEDSRHDPTLPRTDNQPCPVCGKKYVHTLSLFALLWTVWREACVRVSHIYAIRGVPVSFMLHCVSSLSLSLSLSLCLCDRNAVWHSIPTPEGMTMFYQCVEENCGHKWKDESV